MRLVIAAIGLFLLACTDKPVPENLQPAAARPLPPAAPTHPDSVLLARIREQVPADALIRSNACPFECCVYGTWLADSIIEVRETPQLSATPLFTISAGEKLKADSGRVYVTGLAIAIVDDTVVRYADKQPWLLPGDTLVLLDPIGEGYWNMWRRGEVLHEVPPFFETTPEEKRGRLIGTPAREWWVHVTVGTRKGWFHADSAHFRGADACGGPVEGLS